MLKIEFNPSLKYGRYMMDFGDSVILFNMDFKHFPNGLIKGVHVKVYINQLDAIDYLRFKSFLRDRYGLLYGVEKEDERRTSLLYRLWFKYMPLFKCNHFSYGRDFFNYTIPNNVRPEFIETLENMNYRATRISCLLIKCTKLKPNQIIVIIRTGQRCSSFKTSIFDNRNSAKDYIGNNKDWFRYEDIFKD